MLLVIQCVAYCDAANNVWFLTEVLVNVQERLKLALAWNCSIDFVKNIFMSEYVANMVCTLVRSMTRIYSILSNYVCATFAYCTTSKNVTFFVWTPKRFWYYPVNSKRAPYLFENNLTKCLQNFTMFGRQVAEMPNICFRLCCQPR